MGRRGRHSAKTGDGGAERRLAKKLEQQRNNKSTNFSKSKDDLVFHDDPSDGDDHPVDEGSSDEDAGSEQELMQLNDDTEDEHESDLEERDDLDDEDIDEEAFAEEKQRVAKLKDQWGSSKKQFYSADTADYEMDSDMEEIAKDEEDAALELQRKQAELMDEDDFEVGAAAADAAAPDEDEEGRVEDELADIPLVYDQDDAASTIEAVQKDFSKLSKKDKLAFVQQSSPELLGLLDELELYLAQYTENIRPAIEKLEIKARKDDRVAAGLAYMKAKEALVLNYTTNISFYLYCKAQGKVMVDHPVLGHILTLQDKLRTCDQIDQPLDDQLDALLNEELPEGGAGSGEDAEEEDEDDDGLGGFFEDKPVTPAAKKANKKATKKRKHEEAPAPVTVDEAEAEAFYNEVAQAKKMHKAVKEDFYTHEPKIVEPEFDEDDDDDKKRGATYQMIKNKGLKAHKSKINRNPRVKKRMQYKKALVRRKGQVREVRTGETARYGGEMTGIKANITRSRKL